MNGTTAQSVAGGAQATDSDRLEKLPKEIAILLIVAGIGGLLLPGPVGTPFLILGGVTLCPTTFQKLDHWFGRRFPETHKQGMRQVRRFVNDLERRYPTPG
jgi:hypothetical protein